MRWILLAALAACGSPHSMPIDAKGTGDGKKAIDSPRSIDSPGTSPATVNGNLGGAPFTAQDAISGTVTASGFDFNMMSTAVLITDYGGACAHQMTHTGVANEGLLIFVLAATDAGGNSSPISAPGLYFVHPSGSPPPAASLVVEAYFERDGATCTPVTKEFGMSGSLTVNSTGNPVQAMFDVTFANGDHVTGSFSAAGCTALDLNVSPSC